MSKLKKPLSVILSLIMVFSTFALVPGVLLSAKAASVKSSSVTMGDLSFWAPEVIYCYPDAVAQAVTRSHTFEYYVNNTSSGGVQSSYDTTGYIYFRYATASNASLSYRFMNSSFATISGGSVTLSATSNLGTSKDISITAGTTPSLAAATNGCWIEWTLTFTDTKDNLSKKAYAYTYVYKPYTIPVAAGSDAGTGAGGANWAGSATWINGFHSLTEVSGDLKSDWDSRYNLYTEMSNFSAFVDPNGSSVRQGYVNGTAYNGSQAKITDYKYTTDGYSTGYALFANSSASGYYFEHSPSNSNPAYLGTDTKGTYTAPVKNYRVGKYKENTKNVQACVVTNTYGNITIDTSRYSNLCQIPLLGIGMTVTDDEASGGSTGTWYIADYTGGANKNCSGYETWHTGSDNRSEFYSDSGYRIAGQGTGPTDCNYNEKEGIRYAGAWPRTLLGSVNTQGATQMYMVKSFYGNKDGGWYASSHNIVKMNATYRNKANLRAAVQRAIRMMPALGVSGISSGTLSSHYFDANTNYMWTDLQSAYKAAVIALGQLDNASNMDTLATNLNNALDGLKTHVVVNGNGGTVSGDGVDTYVAIGTNQTVSFTPSVTVSNRTGHTFLGWNTSSSATTGSDSVTLGYNNTVYAIWRIHKGTLTVNPNGGTWNGSTSTQNFTQNYNTTKAIPVPTRTGYVFAGWTKSATFNGSISSTTEAATYTFGATDNGTATLTAKWTPITYYVAYNSNGGSGSMSNSTHTYGTAKNLTANAFTKEGYDFNGWNTAANGSGTAYSNSASVNNLTTTNGATVTLYAQWKIKQYTVSFDTKGGSSISPITQNYGTSITAPNNPTKTGYTFDKWTPSVPSTMPASDTTCVASWNANTYKIKYEGNTNTGGATADTSMTYDVNGNIAANGFTKTGYTFSGWNTAANGSGTAYAAGQSVKNLTSTNNGTFTLYAQWTPVNYSLTYNADGGTLTNAAGTTVAYGSKYTIPSNITGTKAHYTFAGFKFSGNNQVYQPGNELPTWEYTSAQTLTAIWTPDTYLVTLTKTDGVSAVTGGGNYTYGAGQATVTATLATGYNFLGWYEGDTLISTSPSYTFSVTKNITLNAKAELKTFTVTFKSGDTVVKTQTVKYGYGADAPATNPTKAPDSTKHYSFASWDRSFNNVTENITVNAVYAEETHSGGTATCTTKAQCTVCNTLYGEIDPNNHNYQENYTGATCTAGAFTTYTCTRCSHSYSVDDEGNPALSHDFSIEVSIDTAPTCTTTGLRTMECSRCHVTSQFVMDALGHETTPITRVEPECEVPGNILYYKCTRCNKLFAEAAATNEIQLADTVIPSTGHDYGDWAYDSETHKHTRVCNNNNAHTETFDCSWDAGTVTTDPTCTTEGVKTFTCTVCGGTRTEPVAKVPHTYIENPDLAYRIEEADCTTPALYIKSCSECGLEHENATFYYGDPLGHTMTKIAYKAPTCTEEGNKEYYYCGRCGKYFYDIVGNTVIDDLDDTIIEATDHDYGDWVYDGNGTTHTRICANDNTHTETVLCTWDDGVIGPDSTCIATGTKTFTCATCGGHKYETVEKKPHVMTVHPEVLPSCETAGTLIYYSCENCRLVYEDYNGDILTTIEDRYLSALDHPTLTYHEEVPNTCLTDGVKAHYTCDLCQKIFFDNVLKEEVSAEELVIPAHGHEYDDWFTVNAPTCMADGLEMRLCKYGDDVQTNVLPTDIDAHNYGIWYYDQNGATHTRICTHNNDHKDTQPCIRGEGKITTYPTCITEGIMTYHCTVCGGEIRESIPVDTVNGHQYETTDCTQSSLCILCGEHWSEPGVHTVRIDEYVAPTCTEFGYTEGSHCRACGMTLVKQKIIAKIDHIPETVPGFAPTCTTTGKTDSTVCTMCGEIIDAPETIKALGHDYNEYGYIVTEATLDSPAVYRHECKRCDAYIDLTDEKEAGTGRRTIRFMPVDGLTFNMQTENEVKAVKKDSYVYWYVNKDIVFTVKTTAAFPFSEYTIRVNGEILAPNDRGVYTIPAGVGYVLVAVEPVIVTPDIGGEEQGGTAKVSFWTMIANFFKRIAEFFSNLFKR